MGRENSWVSGITFWLHTLPPVSLFVTFYVNLPPSVPEWRSFSMAPSKTWKRNMQKKMELQKVSQIVLHALAIQNFASNCLFFVYHPFYNQAVYSISSKAMRIHRGRQSFWKSISGATIAESHVLNCNDKITLWE